MFVNHVLFIFPILVNSWYENDIDSFDDYSTVFSFLKENIVYYFQIVCFDGWKWY